MLMPGNPDPQQHPPPQPQSASTWDVGDRASACPETTLRETPEAGELQGWGLGALATLAVHDPCKVAIIDGGGLTRGPSE